MFCLKTNCICEIVIYNKFVNEWHWPFNYFDSYTIWKGRNIQAIENIIQSIILTPLSFNNKYSVKLFHFILKSYHISIIPWLRIFCTNRLKTLKSERFPITGFQGLNLEHPIETYNTIVSRTNGISMFNFFFNFCNIDAQKITYQPVTSCTIWGYG